MRLIRGTTPTIKITVLNDNLDLNRITAIWVFISQNGGVPVNKEYHDCIIDNSSRTILITLSQEDMLKVRSGDARFQIKAYINGTAIATIAENIEIAEIYKGGIIS